MITCPICDQPANPQCLEDHLAQAKDELTARQHALDQDRIAIDAYERACLVLTGQAD